MSIWASFSVPTSREGMRSLPFFGFALSAGSKMGMPTRPSLRQQAGWANRLSRQIAPGLLCHDVGGVPGRPGVVFARPVKKVRSARALLVLDMGGLAPQERVLQVLGGRERGLRGVDPTWKSHRDLLDQPQIAVGIAERAKGPVAGVLRVGTGLPRLDGERRAVPHVTHVDAKSDEPVVGRLDVGNGQSGLGRARSGGRESFSERDRGPRAWGRELDDAEALEWRRVIVESPTQLRVEAFGPVDVGDGDDVHFEVHVG